VSLGLLAVLLAGGSLVVSVATLIVGLCILRGTLTSARSGEERLEILREQQERLKFMQEERRLFLEELERRREAVVDLERRREIERAGNRDPAPETAAPRRSLWRRIFGGG